MNNQAIQISLPSPRTSRLSSRFPIKHDDHINRLVSRTESILQAILEIMCNSDVFSRVGEDIPSRFWSAYERVAKQHDDEYLERRNGQMDVLLIFVRATFFVSP